jgi:hypothetical protein
MDSIACGTQSDRSARVSVQSGGLLPVGSCWCTPNSRRTKNASADDARLDRGGKDKGVGVRNADPADREVVRA